MLRKSFIHSDKIVSLYSAQRTTSRPFPVWYIFVNTLVMGFASLLNHFVDLPYLKWCLQHVSFDGEVWRPMNRSFTLITQRGDKLEELLTVYLITDYHIRKIAPLTVNFWTYKAESCNPNLPSPPENMSPKYILATSSYRPIEIFTKKRMARREKSETEQGLPWMKRP